MKSVFFGKRSTELTDVLPIPTASQIRFPASIIPGA